MKKLIMTTTAFALFASGPAFAGCGSHGGGTSRGASAASYSRQNYSMAPRATVERKVAAAKAVKAKAAKEVDGSALLADAADLKLQPKQTIAAVEALAGTNPLAPVTAEVARDCKQYSATIGSLINVACE